LADRIVVAYFGDRTALEALVRSAANDRAQVIAVTLDLGGTMPLVGLRDDALAAGAVRCHAMDVRDAFASDVIVPGLRAAGTASSRVALEPLAEAFVRETLYTVARLEAPAQIVEPSGVPLPWSGKPHRQAVLGGALADIAFANGIPVSVNGIPMTITEVLESVETITGEAAVDALHLAYAELNGAADGNVVLAIRDGQVAVASTAAVS